MIQSITWLEEIAVIQAQGLSKLFGKTVAVDDLSFEAVPGRVTGFLGPNGSGKSTTLRMTVGVDVPDAGSVTMNGRRFAEHSYPLREIGVVLEAKAMHPGRTARDHLRWLAASNGLPRRRVDEVLALVGLDSAADRRGKGLSLGMAQRLGVAAALIGDPGVIILDEPVNGLDPEGILWIRTLMRSLAAEGRTVLVSSHLMSEMALTADHVLVLGKGRLIADTAVSDLINGAGPDRVRLVTPDGDQFARLLPRIGAGAEFAGTDQLHVTGVTSRAIGELARDHGLAIYELVPDTVTLEEAFMALTRDSLEYVTPAATDAGCPA